jgi:hypothetical protein
VEVGSINDWQRVRVSFRKVRLLYESFFILVVSISLDASKQCCNRLGVGLSSGHK